MLLEVVIIKESERLQQELDETNKQFGAMSESYERLKTRLNVKDERLNQKDARIKELNLEIEKLKETAQAALKDRFRLKEFHRFLLSTGPEHFSVLEEYMQPWIEEQHELPDSSQTEP